MFFLLFERNPIGGNANEVRANHSKDTLWLALALAGWRVRLTN